MASPIGGLARGIARGIQGQTEQAARRRAEEMALFTSLLGADEEDEPAVRAFAAARGLNLPAIQREAPVEYDVPGLGRIPLRRRDLTRFAPFFAQATQREVAGIRAQSASDIANVRNEFSTKIQQTKIEADKALQDARLQHDREKFEIATTLKSKIAELEIAIKNGQLELAQKLAAQGSWYQQQLARLGEQRNIINLQVGMANANARSGRGRADIGKEDQAMWAGAWDDAAAVIQRDPKASMLSVDEQVDLQEKIANRLFDERKRRRGRGAQPGAVLPVSPAPSGLPNPASARGAIMEDERTGEQWQSDGVQWKRVGPARTGAPAAPATPAPVRRTVSRAQVMDEARRRGVHPNVVLQEYNRKGVMVQ